ncbi:hypothetical protein JHK82_055305 [Glycine max]|nr:hypothetical protein JHK86_055144 [Glycine max]KAG4917837.1 hypothetical protein JHK85_056118 [Glycine max]KAG5073935.1 hypothetical protein JHK84_055166 [Glycine max]KAG5076610.1 hypothetical protein JHK82_055305 [Glycine max]
MQEQQPEVYYSISRIYNYIYCSGHHNIYHSYGDMETWKKWKRPNLSENSNKGSIATPRVSKTSKLPTVERKSPRPSATPPDAGIETVKKKKEEWQKKIESVRNQHALNMDSLLSTTQELQRVKQQLALTCYAKNQALNHADDATKIVEILAEKAEFLSSELMRLKALLDSKVETEARQNQLILKLKTDIEALKEELEKSKGYDDKLSERESFIELLNVELVASKMDESYARTLLEEWHTKVEELEMRIEEANKLEIYASEYLESIMKRVEGNNDLLHEAESEVDTLKEKVELLEMTIGRQRADVEDSQCQLCKAKEESLEKSKEVEALTSELERVKEEKAQALNDVKLAASSSMLDEARYEINVLVCIIENSKSAFENSKAEWEQRELQLVSCIKKNEEEKVSLEKEIKRLLYLLKETEEEANANREEEA